MRISAGRVATNNHTGAAYSGVGAELQREVSHVPQYASVVWLACSSSHLLWGAQPRWTTEVTLSGKR